MRVERREAQPILRAVHGSLRVIANTLGIAVVGGTSAPTIDAIVAGWRELNKIPIVLSLEGDRRERELLRIGIVGREMTPERDQRAVDLFTTNRGGQTVAFGHHNTTSDWLAGYQQEARD